MAVIDFTPVQELLGKEVCFLDLAFERSLDEFKDDLDQLYLERFKFGKITGCTIDLNDFGQLSYRILLDESYYSLNDLQLLFISNNAS